MSRRANRRLDMRQSDQVADLDRCVVSAEGDAAIKRCQPDYKVWPDPHNGIQLVMLIVGTDVGMATRAVADPSQVAAGDGYGCRYRVAGVLQAINDLPTPQAAPTGDISRFRHPIDGKYMDLRHGRRSASIYFIDHGQQIANLTLLLVHKRDDLIEGGVHQIIRSQWQRIEMPGRRLPGRDFPILAEQ